MKILVIGSGGNIGTPLVQALMEKGIEPTVGVRDAQKAKDKWGSQVQVVSFDYERPSSFANALAGQEAVFFIAGHSNPVPSVTQLLAAAKSAGVKRMVFSSGRTTGDVPGKPLNDVENLVKGWDGEWTILRPGWFMQNFVNWLGGTIRAESKLFLPAAAAKTAFVDVRDIADVAIKCLLEEGHHGQLYNLTSDEALNHEEVCSMISEASGKKVVYVPQERETYLQTMMERGWTNAAANYTADLYKYVLSGKEEEISDDVARILGKTPRRFQAFAKEHANRF
ncbi:MAG: SDR family oxidoreductase [Saprospiraceae bacterium]|nr:SDR family oxidoreductase [Saprospiraceae bacterium]